MSVFNYLKSTILSKIVMAATGLVLVLFIIGHLAGNLQILIGKEVFNTYAHFLQNLGELLWVIRGVLFLCLVLHIITSIRLKLYNNAAKGAGYKIKSYAKAKLTSRTMIWTGILIFAFLSYHLAHFTLGKVEPQHYGKMDYYENDASYFVQMNTAGAEEAVVYENSDYTKTENAKVLFNRHDAYYMVIMGFRNPVIVISYLIFVLVLGFHLSHAIQSMFQTLGISGPVFTPWMIKASNLLSFLIAFMYSVIPLTILLGLVGGDV